MGNYAARRERWYEPLQTLFPWETIGEEEYALASWAVVSHQQCQELQEAAEALAALWHKVALVASQGDSRLLRWLGLPAGTREAVRESLQLPWLTALGRFDFVRTAAVGDVVSSFIAAQIEGVRAAAALQGVGGLSISAPECGSALRADDEVAACTAGKYDGTGG